MTVLDVDDTPDEDLVRCYYTDTQSKQFNIGLFHRVHFAPAYYCTYSLGGGFVNDHNEGTLSTDERNKERGRCDAYVDTSLCPESGNAKFEFSDGSVFDGQWSGKQPSGMGTKTLKDGSWMKGNWQDGVLAKGNGEIKLAQGKYNGEINNGKMTGNGVMTTSGGSYEGLFEDGAFKTGMIKKTSGYSSRYEYNGSVENSSFLDGKCEYCDGCIFDGKWLNMKLMEGTATIPTNDVNYPVFVGEVVAGKLVNGAFANKAGYVVKKNYKDSAYNNNLSIVFQNGDQCNGVWDVVTGQLVPASVFEYIWQDGVKCSYIVDNKLRLSKASYFDAEGNPAKSKIAKKRVMMNTDGEGYTIQTFNVKAVADKFNRNTELP